MLLDTRALLATADAIELRPSSIARGESVCDYCVMRDAGCSLERASASCETFILPLSFADETGLQGSFSTWRGSAIWYDRARVAFKSHQRMALVNSRSGALIGFARITDAHRDGFAALMRDHAKTNHLVKDRGLSPEDGAIWLAKWIRDHLGSRFTKEPLKIGTVIYLQREPDAQAD